MPTHIVEINFTKKKYIKKLKSEIPDRKWRSGRRGRTHSHSRSC